MSSISKSRLIIYLLFLASMAVGVIVGISALYASNLDNPVFLARALSEEEVYAVTSTRIIFGVMVGYDVKDIVTGIIKDVVLTASREYPDYASRHGVDPDQSWTLHAVFISDDGNVTLGEVWIQWDSIMYEMSVYGSRPYSMLHPHYEVIIKRRAAMTFKSDWENKDFGDASVHFREFTDSGDLVWRRED